MRWKRWGPYLSERQWGTVREDYSPYGNAWDYFPHDHARSRAYRWGEDGLAGISDDTQRLCLALALWNGKDPILKERLFGLTNGEGNHGEDVKELYYYLDATPTHSYLKMLYKYPQRAFPYAGWSRRTAAAARTEPEFELLDTGVFDDDRYFDVFVEYAKAGPDDLLMLVTVAQPRPRRGDAPRPAAALVPQHLVVDGSNAEQPATSYADGRATIGVEHASCSATTRCYAEGEPDAPVLRERDERRPAVRRRRRQGLLQGRLPRVSWSHGRRDAVNPAQHGTKAAAHYQVDGAGAGQRAAVRLRLAHGRARRTRSPTSTRCSRSAAREADAFYADLQAGLDDPDARHVQRQAFAGMIWSKQFYHYDVPRWLEGDPAQPPPPRRAPPRPQQRLAAPQQRRRHLDAGQVGVSLVRRLGPRLPLHPARADRRRSSPSSSSCC